MKKVLFLLGVMALVFSTVCWAANGLAAVEGNSVTLTLSAAPGQRCQVTVVEEDYTEEGLKNEIPEKLHYQGEATADAEGNLRISITMPDAAQSGTYVARIRPGDGEVQEISFSFYSQSQRQEIIDRINSAAQQDIPGIIKENSEILGLSTDVEGFDLDAVYQRMANWVSAENKYTTETIISSYQECLALEAIAQNVTEVAMKDGKLNNLTYTKLDDTKEYELYLNELSEEGIAKVNSSIMGKSFDSISQLQEEFSVQALLKAFSDNKMSGYGHVSGLVEEYREELEENLGVDLSDYDAASSKSEFARKLMQQDLSTPEKLAQAFETAGESGETGGSGNTGGGSSGGSGSSSGGRPSGSSSTIPSGISNFEIGGGSTAETAFVDLDTVEWAREDIEALAEEGILQGKYEGHFCPNDSITREEFIKMLVLALDLYDQSATCAFTDVQPQAWYTSYVASAVQNGVIQGYDDGSFGVGKPITREEMAVIACRAGVLTGRLNESEETATGFRDDAMISQWAKTGVAAMTQAGILSGVGENNFDPAGISTRAQAARVINLLK